MFKKNLNLGSRLLRGIVGLAFVVLSFVFYNPTQYLLIYLFMLGAIWLILSAAMGWSPFYAMFDMSDYPVNLNRVSKADLEDALGKYDKDEN